MSAGCCITYEGQIFYFLFSRWKCNEPQLRLLWSPSLNTLDFRRTQVSSQPDPSFATSRLHWNVTECCFFAAPEERKIHWKRHFLLAPSCVTQQRLFVYKGPGARLENQEVLNRLQANPLTALNSASLPLNQEIMSSSLPVRWPDGDRSLSSQGLFPFSSLPLTRLRFFITHLPAGSISTVCFISFFSFSCCGISFPAPHLPCFCYSNCWSV